MTRASRSGVRVTDETLRQRPRNGFVVRLRRHQLAHVAATIAGTRRSRRSPPTALRCRSPHTRTDRRSLGRGRSSSCARRARRACRQAPARSDCAGAAYSASCPLLHRHAKRFSNHQTIPALDRASDGRRSAAWLAVTARPVHRDGIDGAACPQPRGREDRRHVGRERLLQRLQRHERIVGLLIAGKRLAIDEMGLHVGARPARWLLATSDSIGSVTLCDWSSMYAGRKSRHTRPFGIDELVENQEQLKRLDRSRIEVVVSVLAVVEVKPAELAELNQPRDDQLDVDVRRVMAEIDERERADRRVRARSSSSCPSRSGPSNRTLARRTCAR